MPPGDYFLLTEEVRLEGLTFNAYRRIAGFMIDGGGRAFSGGNQYDPGDRSRRGATDHAGSGAGHGQLGPAFCRCGR
jgi:hypothetical protein